jgi:hypothetical protein
MRDHTPPVILAALLGLLVLRGWGSDSGSPAGGESKSGPGRSSLAGGERGDGPAEEGGEGEVPFVQPLLDFRSDGWGEGQTPRISQAVAALGMVSSGAGPALLPQPLVSVRVATLEPLPDIPN